MIGLKLKILGYITIFFAVGMLTVAYIWPREWLTAPAWVRWVLIAVLVMIGTATMVLLKSVEKKK